jgi:hypothetical protein
MNMVIDATKEKENLIGRLGENDATVIRFPVEDILCEFPGCSFSLVNRRPKDRDGYPVNTVTQEGNYVLWTVKSGDLAQEGTGECELIATQNNVIKKTVIYTTRIFRAISGTANPPEPWESWVQHVKDDADRADAAADLLEHPGAEAETLAPGETATASYSNGTFHFGIPQGTPGYVNIDDTAGAGDTDKTWSADREVREFAAKADRAYAEKTSVLSYADKNLLKYPLLDKVEASDGVTILSDELCNILRTAQAEWRGPDEGPYYPYFKLAYKDTVPAGTRIYLKFDYLVRSAIPGGTRPSLGHGIRFHEKDLYSDGTEPSGRYLDDQYSELNVWKTYTTDFTVAKDTIGVFISTRSSNYGIAQPDWCAFDFKNFVVSTENVTWDYSLRSTTDKKADKRNTVLETSLSRGRKEGTIIPDTSFAFGNNVEASNGLSFAIGTMTQATGYCSVAEGRTTIASSNYQHVAGNLNVEDANDQYSFIVGNGTEAPTTRSNAFALEWNGTAHFNGDVYVGCNPDSTGGTKLATITEVDTKISTSEKGAVNGVAELDAGGKVPSAQLPSFVDDVLEFEYKRYFPMVGESGKIYVALDTNKTYRWGGSTYVEISESLALGETSTTAYRGDYGKAAFGHAQAAGNQFANGFYKITTNVEGHVTEAEPVTKADITALGVPGEIPIDDTAGSGVTNKVWSSNKLTSEFDLKAPKENPVFTGSISLDRVNESVVGDKSVAVGAYVEASGRYSQAEGCGLVASHRSQHVFGEYNYIDPSPDPHTSRGFMLEMVGNGSSAVSRSNARSLDWYGNEHLKGKLYVEGDGFASGTEVAKVTDIVTYEDATQSIHGLMSAEDKVKLDGLVVIPSAPSTAGTYKLQCVVVDGVSTLSWVSDT